MKPYTDKIFEVDGVKYRFCVSINNRYAFVDRADGGFAICCDVAGTVGDWEKFLTWAVKDLVFLPVADGWDGV